MLADTPNAVGWARKHTRDVLRCWQAPPDLIDAALLVVSELATNAIRHQDTKQPEPLTSAELTTVRLFGLDLQLRGQAVFVALLVGVPGSQQLVDLAAAVHGRVEDELRRLAGGGVRSRQPTRPSRSLTRMHRRSARPAPTPGGESHR